MNKSKAKKTNPNHTTPKKIDNGLQLLDIKIAKDFDISPFIYDKDGIEFVDILLDNLSLSKEFKKEICMKFIQSVFAPADEKKNQLAYDIIHYVELSKKCTMHNLLTIYHKKFSIKKSNNTMEYEKALSKNKEQKILTKADNKIIEKFNKSKSEFKITITYKGHEEYEHIIDYPEEKDAVFPMVDLGRKIESISKLLSKITQNLPKEQKEKKILDISNPAKEGLEKIFIYFSKILFSYIDQKLQDETKELIIKIFLDSYLYLNIDKTEINEMLEKCFSLKPKDTIECLNAAKEIGKATGFAMQILEKEQHDIELKKFALDYKLKALYGLYYNENYKKLFLEYLDKKEFHEILLSSPIKEEIFGKESYEYIMTKFNIVFIDYTNTKELSNEEILSSDVLTIIKNDLTKKALFLSIKERNTQKINDILSYLFDKGYNIKIFLDYVLENINISDSDDLSENIKISKDFVYPLYVYLEDLFKKDYSAKEKISRSKELYSFKLKLESEAQISEKAPDHIQKGIDSAELESEAQTYINNNLVSYKEPATTNIQVIEKKPLTIFQTLHKAFKLQKKLAYEKQGLKIPEHNPSWSIDKIQYIYTEKTTQNEMIPHNTKYVTKITSSFGHQIYIAIKDEIKEDKKFLTNESKFISASDHWAGGFFNKSGIKFLHHHNKVGGYEIKIMDNDARLFTKKTYINKEKDCLLIFDQIVGHTEISIDKPIEEILVDDFQTNLGGRDFSTDLIQ